MLGRADRRKFHYIYKITRNDGKYYIGLHSTDDLDDGYFGSGKRLRRSINKHGKDAHRKEILEFLPNRELLKQRERELVNEESLNDPLCMNLVVGGNTCEGYRHTEETKQRLSVIGKNKTEAGLKKIREKRSSQVIVHSEETRRKMSESQKGKPRPDEAIRKQNEIRQKKFAKNFLVVMPDGEEKVLTTTMLGLSNLIGIHRGAIKWCLSGNEYKGFKISLMGASPSGKVPAF